MNNKKFVLLLTACAATSMIHSSNDGKGGFFEHIGRGVGDIVSSPAYIGRSHNHKDDFLYDPQGRAYRSNKDLRNGYRYNPDGSQYKISEKQNGSQSAPNRRSQRRQNRRSDQ